jgi:hypothetical protein
VSLFLFCLFFWDAVALRTLCERCVVLVVNSSFLAHDYDNSYESMIVVRDG